jgi:hypothetical protein
MGIYFKNSGTYPLINIPMDPRVNRPKINKYKMPTAHCHFDTVDVSRFESLIGYLLKDILENLELLAASR